MKLAALALFALSTLPLMGQPSPKVWSTYHDHAALTRELSDLQRTYPTVIRVESLGKSVQGRDIWLVTLGKEGTRDKPQVLFDGAMHGSELIGSEGMLAYIRYLAEHYATDFRIRQAVDSIRTFVIPMVNPDGVEAGKKARLWKQARKNANGVNLNRNFDWNWDEAGAEDPAKEDYRGPRPFSEPESRILRDFISSHQLAVYVNGHAGENREPHLVTPLHSKDGARYDAIAAEIEEKAAFTRARGALAGGAFNWAYWTRTPRPLSIALEIYADAGIEPQSVDWWSRYNPSDAELPDYLRRVRETLLTMTAQALRGSN